MQSITVTLPDELVQAVASKVASGEFESESAVISEGLRVLLAEDDAIERWLRDEVAAGCREMAADPSLGIPLEEVLGRIERRVLGQA